MILLLLLVQKWLLEIWREILYSLFLWVSIRRAGILLFLFLNEFFLRADHSLASSPSLLYLQGPCPETSLAWGAPYPCRSHLGSKSLHSWPPQPTSGASPCSSGPLFFSLLSLLTSALSTTRNLLFFLVPLRVTETSAEGKVSIRAPSSLGHLG